jgi:hypothetical protein
VGRQRLNLSAPLASAGLHEGAVIGLGRRLVSPPEAPAVAEPARFGRLARYRQWIEAITDTFKANSPSKTTPDAPSPVSTPASPPDCSH